MLEAAQFLSAGIGFLNFDAYRCFGRFGPWRASLNPEAANPIFGKFLSQSNLVSISIDLGTDDLLLGISNGFGPRYQAWKSPLVRIPLRFRFRSNSV